MGRSTACRSIARHEGDRKDMLRVLVEGTEGAEAARELPIPPLAFGLLTLAVFAALLLVTFAFRSVGNRH
jgi:hypothetical protein